MELKPMTLPRIGTARTQTPPNPALANTLANTLARIVTRTSTLASDRLHSLRRSTVWRLLSKSWAGRTRGKGKRLSVRETAALGDRRFVSVIQFENHRFLIGSSPSSVTLLSQLADESVGDEETRDQNAKEDDAARKKN